MLLAAEISLGFVEAMLPFWPLLAAIVVGLMLATGKAKAFADRAVILGVGLSALSALWVLFVTSPKLPEHEIADWSAGHNAATEEHSQEAGELPVGNREHSSPAGNRSEGQTASAPLAGDGQPGDHADEHGPAAQRFATLTLLNWISLRASLDEEQWAAIGLFVDPLTAVMLVTVTLVSLMVVIYSMGYMRDHHGHCSPGYERFFAFLGLFVFSMGMLVLAGNFVLLYLGWELVGLCSYLLIGFWYHKPEAAAAAKKAFIVNRIGDFGFALGIFALYMFIHPHVAPGENALDYTVVFDHVRGGDLSANQATLVSLLLLCGAVGKSAQFPLYVWLPDAMEGPTPVSALIHAATMVTAGVYMVARCGVIFAASPIALDVVAIIGAFTAFFAATMAMAQFDMKRILAYSTISQLAYMFVGLGAGAPDSAVFHLYTHAFFKALLFLCAGSVMHAMGGVIDLRKFSGLRRVLPKTYWLTLIGCLALAGCPLLAGFWSKDEIIHAALEKNWLLGGVMLATAAMTAYYTFRMFFLCFHGPLRLPEEAGDHPHESPPAMIGPLAFLAVGAVLAGYVGVSLHAGGDAFLGIFAPHGLWHAFLSHSTIVVGAEHAAGDVPWLMYISAAIALGGIGVAWLRFGEAPRIDPDEALLGRAWRLMHAKWYMDEAYDRLFVQPLRAAGRFFFSVDKAGVDGAVNTAAIVPVGLGSALRLLQRGSVQTYGLGMLVGVSALLIWWMATE